MTTISLPPAFTKKRLLLVISIVTAVLVVGYVMLLNHEERVMEQYYKHLRETDAELYLSKIMQARGFPVFLKEYLTVHDYSKPISEAPAFLVGRWALFDVEKRVSDDFVPDACAKGVEVEDGMLKVFDDKVTSYPALYSMKGTMVTAHLQGTANANIEVIGYGSHLHHIKAFLPGSTKPQYGYLCH